MAEPHYKITAARAAPDGKGGFSEIIWNAICVDSTGFEHRHGKGYRLGRIDPELPDAHHSPVAAALLAEARDEAGVMAAVHADAARVLAELEARATGAVPVPMHFVVPAPVPYDPDADPLHTLDNDP